MLSTLKELMNRRKSRRKFSSESLTDKQIDMLAWSFHKIPSAGNIHPLCLFIVTDHRIQTKQDFVGKAPLVMVIAADFKKIKQKYGSRAERYVYLEAGHSAQNILLMAEALGLVACPVGAFNDKKVSEVLKLEDDCKPVYLIVIGK